jgi:ATP-dependent helicase YprA (DUF1998 family)
MSATIEQTIGELKATLIAYIEATYHIGDPAMVRQRQRLLEQVGGIFQRPYLESTPRYTAGRSYGEMTELPPAVREAFVALSNPEEGPPVIFDPPYQHQEQAVHDVLVKAKNLMIMTGTGSGKTESFLLPIVGKLALEAAKRPDAFRDFHAMRAIVLYPMNALVNDQLGRLRLLFGNPRVVKLFENLAGRPARFARYTSRTPYAGVRMKNKDGDRLASLGEFFANIENAARRHAAGKPNVASEDAAASALFHELKTRGKWPAKESVADWFGNPGDRWLTANGEFKRAVLREHDAELLTRHEVQESPPDLLITNYSMLEYMMMRPIERPIFDKTRAWLDAFPDEKILVVMDEAHLYRGAQGAEVGLLLRRFRERLNIGADRFQVICATASFEDKENAGRFGADLTGTEKSSFVPVTGAYAFRSPASGGTQSDVDALNSVDIDQFYDPDASMQLKAVEGFLAYRQVPSNKDVDACLFQALSGFKPFNLLVNETMTGAVPVAELGERVFPGLDAPQSSTAISSLLAIGSRARTGPDKPSLLPCRVHSFFRGLPGLWVCLDSGCSELDEDERGGPAGKMYSQPWERCPCGSPVLEYYTCRHCGTSYARAYTDDVANPKRLWATPGERMQNDQGFFDEFKPVDLLLEEPAKPELGRAAIYDLNSGMLDSPRPSERHRTVYLPPAAGDLVSEDEDRSGSPGEFVPCACCQGKPFYGQSSVQDHQTKGDQPFQALLSTQIRIQPPGPQPSSEFAPLRGRKVLIFSDSRQMAARLAPLLQTYSLKDTVRALLPLGLKLLKGNTSLGPTVGLDNAFLAVLVAAQKFGVRIRPSLKSGEAMPRMDAVAPGGALSDTAIFNLMNNQCPADLLSAIVDVIRDGNLGLEALAVASLRERSDLTEQLIGLPTLPGLAEDGASKLAVARAWMRCWQRRPGPGIWFRDMPQQWWSEEVISHKGKFSPMDRVLRPKGTKRFFEKEWLPRLAKIFTQKMDDGGTRILASFLTLEMDGEWKRCMRCKSVHRPIAGVPTCIDCEAENCHIFDPNEDEVFLARKGYYRTPVSQALETMRPNLISLIAAEHTAQLNAAQPDDAFSLAENHEIRFQDVNLAWRETDPSEPAIDVLSSTTTMEVGIDIGALSGVALRNMPPGRANYQQRAGRAGRRGNAVATVVAFGSSDSHDDHYFIRPDEMIRGPVTDPRLTLENEDIARRHVRAFLLQRYHEARTPDIDPQANPTLFSVLGSVGDFRDGTGILNRDDFAKWMKGMRFELMTAVDRWLPTQLPVPARARLIEQMIVDVLREVDEAVGYVFGSVKPTESATAGETISTTNEVEKGESGEDDRADPLADKLLDRLLYRGVLPRYAFPTDVAPFYVFNKSLSTPFRPKMEFAPAQGLNIALSQYAPNKQIWIRGKQYTSKAIYSPYRDERSDAWRKRRLYFECSVCHHAKTELYYEEGLREVRDCEACRSSNSFGPAKRWFRPPGFAHPIDREPVTKADELIESAYATRAKLVMQTPSKNKAWIAVNERVRAFPTREYLLASNSGPDGDGYHYCTGCGRIESAKDPETNLFQQHSRPFLSDESEACPGTFTASKIVLGTDFVTDISLFSLSLSAPFRLRPGNTETNIALRTICEAVAKAACRMLEIESGEILAEYRPALTELGALGTEVEIFLYDTLSGGAGFSTQLAGRAAELFRNTLGILSGCPEGCDASCYRCLRSFRNKLDHRFLDRKVGEQLLRAALEGGYPEYPPDRIQSALDVLFTDLTRQLSTDFQFERDVVRTAKDSSRVRVPMLAIRRADLKELWISLASPVAPEVPADTVLRQIERWPSHPVFPIDELMVRTNLPAAVGMIVDQFRKL